MNFFGPESAAERYAKGRPFFHPLVARRISEVLGLGGPLARARRGERDGALDGGDGEKRFFSTRPSGTCGAMLEREGA